MTDEDKKITIIGCGRLGLCLALCFDRAKYDVLAVDIFPDYVKALNDRSFNSKEPRVNEFLAEAGFRATCDISEGIAHSKILYVLVDTPSTGGDRHYDTSKLGNVLAAINRHQVKDKHVIIGCTIMPGYIRNIATHLLRDCENVSISYNPEFIQQGDIVRGFLNPDMVLVGEGCKEVGDHMEELYKNVCENTPVISRMAAESAEICKIAINCFITTKISYCNMVGDIADRTPGESSYIQCAHSLACVTFKVLRRTRSWLLWELTRELVANASVQVMGLEDLASPVTTVLSEDMQSQSVLSHSSQWQLTSTTICIPRS